MTRRGRGRPPHPEILTPAEQRVLNELRRGGTNAEIAERLGVSLDAVKYHISNMLGKLELDNREQLAAWRGNDNSIWPHRDDQFWERQANWCLGRRWKSSAAKEQAIPCRSASRARVTARWPVKRR